MFHKRDLYFFVSLNIMSLSVYAQNHEVTSIILFLKKLSYTMWYSFFFIPKIFGALLMGNILYIIQALILLACMIILEGYLLNRFIKVRYKLSMRRMALINLIDIVIQTAIAHPLFYLIDLHNYTQSLYTKAYSLYGLTILASLILLIVRIITAYTLYRFFDKTTAKNVLRSSMIKINCISYIFIVSVFFIAKSSNYNII
ncbi:hypothetical protein HYV10_03045 [Candidatus Dependentiae bacterium]|nr:hypothetical protein [Candidatus Dependentiae bacterium]